MVNGNGQWAVDFIIDHFGMKYHMTLSLYTGSVISTFVSFLRVFYFLFRKFFNDL